MSDKATKEELERTKDISDEQIASDIEITRAEIEALRGRVAANKLLAVHGATAAERSIAKFKIAGEVHEIDERVEFVFFLRRLQEARAEAGHGE